MFLMDCNELSVSGNRLLQLVSNISNQLNPIMLSYPLHCIGRKELGEVIHRAHRSQLAEFNWTFPADTAYRGIPRRSGLQAFHRPGFL